MSLLELYCHVDAFKRNMANRLRLLHEKVIPRCGVLVETVVDQLKHLLHSDKRPRHSLHQSQAVASRTSSHPLKLCLAPLNRSYP